MPEEIPNTTKIRPEFRFLSGFILFCCLVGFIACLSEAIKTGFDSSMLFLMLFALSGCMLTGMLTFCSILKIHWLVIVASLMFVFMLMAFKDAITLKSVVTDMVTQEYYEGIACGVVLAIVFIYYKLKKLFSSKKESQAEGSENEKQK